MAARRSRRPSPKPKAARPTLAQLERRIARLLAERQAERARHARQIASVRRGADRRLTVMLREITELRHHEARAHALERLLEKREAAGQAPLVLSDLTEGEIKETSLRGLSSVHEQDPHSP